MGVMPPPPEDTQQQLQCRVSVSLTFGSRERMTSGSSSAYAWPLWLSGLSPPISACWLYTDSPWRVSQILRALVMPPLHTCRTRGGTTCRCVSELLDQSLFFGSVLMPCGGHQKGSCCGHLHRREGDQAGDSTCPGLVPLRASTARRRSKQLTDNKQKHKRCSQRCRTPACFVKVTAGNEVRAVASSAWTCLASRENATDTHAAVCETRCWR